MNLERVPMKKTTQANGAADDRSAGLLMRGAPSIGPEVPYVGGLLRLVRLRSRKAVKETDDTAPSRGRRPDHGSDVARTSMEAGLTRGASLLFGEFGSRG
jgi:hypothetical protein